MARLGTTASPADADVSSGTAFGGVPCDARADFFGLPLWSSHPSFFCRIRTPILHCFTHFTDTVCTPYAHMYAHDGCFAHFAAESKHIQPSILRMCGWMSIHAGLAATKICSSAPTVPNGSLLATWPSPRPNIDSTAHNEIPVFNIHRV